MSWLDDFEVSDIHDFLTATMHATNYDGDGDPTAWVIRLHKSTNNQLSVVDVFSCRGWRTACEVIDHIRLLQAVHRRLTV